MKLDSKGNIIAGSLAILIISLLIVFIFVFTSMNYIENENIESNCLPGCVDFYKNLICGMENTGCVL